MVVHSDLSNMSNMQEFSFVNMPKTCLESSTAMYCSKLLYNREHEEVQLPMSLSSLS